MLRKFLFALVFFRILLFRVQKAEHHLLHKLQRKKLLYVGSLVGVLVQEHHDQVLQVLRINFGNGVLFFLNDFNEQTHQVSGFEGVLQGAKLVEDAAQTPDVGLEGIGLVLAGFRRHVVGSSHDGFRIFESALQNFADSEVPDFDNAVRV